jgi:hypothetical protein
MLARLPFRLGLGRVWTPSFIFRPLRPICILVRTRILFCFMYDLDLCIAYLDILTRGVFLVIIYSFVGSIMSLCNCCYLDSTRITCMLQRARDAWWCVSKATSCRLWLDRYNLQGAGFGALQVVSEPGFVDTHGSSLPVG